jgi:hypothetical protein
MLRRILGHTHNHRGEHMKTWERPTLIVLGRGTPEESVLDVCKGHDTANVYPGSDGRTTCWQQGNNAHTCRGVTGS